jgi:hypothetical protein
MFWNRYGSVGISSRPQAGRPSIRVSIPGGEEVFLFFITSRAALGPTQHPVRWVPGAVSPGVRQPGPEAEDFHLVPRLRVVELHLHSYIRLHGVVLN